MSNYAHYLFTSIASPDSFPIMLTDESNETMMMVIGEKARDSQIRLFQVGQHLGIDTLRLQQLLWERAKAKKSKDFAASDAYRFQILSMGFELRDTPEGAQWLILKQ